MGSDGILAFIVKGPIHNINFILASIFNWSSLSGTFTSIWKYALIIPISKPGPCDVSNFPSILVLGTNPKIFERTIRLPDIQRIVPTGDLYVSTWLFARSLDNHYLSSFLPSTGSIVEDQEQVDKSSVFLKPLTAVD